jgi:cold shock CspA family protein
MEKQIGFVRSYTDKKYGHIITKDGEYFVRVRDIVPDEGSFAYLARGERVLFEIGGERAPNGYERAINVVPMDRQPVEPLNEDYRETVTLLSWDGKSGWAHREYGTDLLVYATHITTEGEETLKPGSRLYVGIEPDPVGERFIAKPIEICVPESEDLEMERCT